MKNKLMDMIRYFGGRLSFRNIGAMLAMSKTTVSTYFKKWEEKGLPKGKSSLDECTPSELYVHLNGKERESGKIAPDFSNVERRLAEHGTTRARLWAEYRDGLEDPAKGLGYAQYTRRLAKEATARGLVLRRTHEPGYVAFVDYSGKRPSYCDKATGEAVPVELFVGVLGASGYTFACCTASQAVPDWLDAHTQMLAFFGGAPATVSPDNLKSAIADAGKDPTVQEHYEPPRLSRRLHLLRGWSNEQVSKFSERSTGACGSAGAGTAGQPRIAMVGDRFGRGKDRLYARDVAALGASG